MSRPGIPRGKKRRVRTALLAWYRRNGRALPWRGITNPYRILVSEIMLQQTQVNRVLEKYPAFLQRFPTVHALATARQRDVVMAWRGMGYNNRAIRLHRLARLLLENHGGRFPQNTADLMALPGIGKYTAHALLSSAFSVPCPAIDVNARRVFSRVLRRMPTTGDMLSERTVWDLAAEILPEREAYEWNQAVMDFGATVCTARQPACGACPIAGACSSRAGMKRVTVRRQRTEPSRNGIPNRLYRGRVIEHLRGLGGRGSVALGDIAAGLLGNHRSGALPWVRTLLAGLEEDGLIRVRGEGKRTRIALA